MAKLIYPGLMSLDGYVADQAGKFDWTMPDTEVHTAINDLTRSVSTFLLGQRMYEVLVAWERMDVANQPTVIKDFAQIWGRPTRSCTPPRSRPRRASGHGSKASSTSTRSGG